MFGHASQQHLATLYHTLLFAQLLKVLANVVLQSHLGAEHLCLLLGQLVLVILETLKKKKNRLSLIDRVLK